MLLTADKTLQDKTRKNISACSVETFQALDICDMVLKQNI